MVARSLPDEQSARSRLSEARIEALLDVASEVFLEHGFDGSSVGEIARRAKASKETFYSRYPTKEQLFIAVMHRRADRSAAEFAGILRANQDVRATLLRFGQELLTLALSDDAIRMQRIISTEAQRFPELGRTFYESGRGIISARLAIYLGELTNQGVLAVAHARIIADQLVDAISGEPLRRAVLGVGEVSTKERNQRVTIAVEAFLRAYRTPAAAD